MTVTEFAAVSGDTSRAVKERVYIN
ncbi:uncharacterized protein G2W53_011846 [Senna tora]|uniref:Uncharacterized protein n=1 Tax=Senna tora TaxID=362788 RepID=A0A834TVW1_9FABA|nr:uncharacterized protein G2W53_011846 [Senna tora]